MAADSLRRLWIGPAAALLAAAVVVAVLRDGETAAWAATDVAIGGGLPLLGVTLALMAVTAPTRARATRPAIAHGLLAGTAWAWFAWVMLETELPERHDRLFALGEASAGAIILGRLLGQRVLYWVARAFLADAGREEAVSFARAILLAETPARAAGTASTVRALLPRLAAWGARCRRRLGLGPTRSFAVERAFEHATDESVRDLREGLDDFPARDLGGPAVRAAQRAAAELDLLRIVLEVEPRSTSPLEMCTPRVAVTWDLLRYALALLRSTTGARAPGMEMPTQLLSQAIAAASPAGSKVAEAAEQARRGRYSSRLVTALSARSGAKLALPDALAAVMTADLLLDDDMALWALGVIAGVEQRAGPPEDWRHLTPSLARVRAACDHALLRHRGALETAFVAVRGARAVEGARLADAPERIRFPPSEVTPGIRRTFEGAPCAPERRTTAGRLLIDRIGWRDPGAGRTAVAITVTLVLGAVTWSYVHGHPLGPIIKSLRDIHRGVGYRGAPLLAADSSPGSGRIVVGSAGLGVHEIDTNTFRIRTQRAGPRGPISDWIPAVAAGADGAVLAATAPAPATGAASPDSARGADLRLPDGSWRTLIAPLRVPGLTDRDIESIVACGGDRLLVCGARLVLYRTGDRSLVELKPRDQKGLPAGARIAIAAGCSGEDSCAWVATRQADDASPRRLFLLRWRPDGSYEALPERQPALEAEGIAQLVPRSGRLWVRTPLDRLYSRTSAGWQLLVDGDTSLDLDRVADVVCEEGEAPAIWLSEVDGRGEPLDVRVRALTPGRVLPCSPWFRADLTSGAPASSGTKVGTTDVRLGSGAPPPAARYNETRHRHELLVAGSQSGLVLFHTRAAPVAVPEAARLEATLIATPGERVVWFDVLAGALVVVLESKEARRRRLVTARWTDDLDTLARLDGPTVQQTALLDPALFGSAQIVAVRPAGGRGPLQVITDNGRLLDYDMALHGWTSPEGATIVDAAGQEIAPLASGDVAGSAALLLDRRSRIFEVDLDAARLDQGKKVAARLVHQPGAPHPQAALEPARVASEPDGTILFMAGAGRPECAPWRLSLEPAGTSLLSWTAEPTPEDQPLQTESITRLQSGPRVGCLVALGAKGELLHRRQGRWHRAEGAASGWRRIVECVGGTFVEGAAGIALVAPVPAGASVGPLLWRRSEPVLQLPVSAIAGLRIDEARSGLLVGHAKGLSIYDPVTCGWSEVDVSPKLAAPTSPAGWTFLGNGGESGACSHVWAIRGTGASPQDIALVRQRTAVRIPIDSPRQVIPVGAGLAVLRADGTVVTVDPSGRVSPLSAEPAVGLDAGRFVRVVQVSSSTLVALDERGRLLKLTADGGRILLERAGVDAEGLRDLEATSDGAVALIDEHGEVSRWDFSRNTLKRLGVTAGVLERVGSGVLAARPEDGAVFALTGDGGVTLAGGRSRRCEVGGIDAAFMDGDRLWVSGARGGAVRRPERRRFEPIREGAGLDRFDRVGRMLFAWRGESALSIAENNDGAVATPLGRDVRSLLSSNRGAPVALHVGAAGAPLVAVGLTDGALEALFRSDARFDRIDEAAPLAPAAAVLRTGAGGIVRYDLGTRSLTTVQLPVETSRRTQLLSGEGRVYVAPEEGGTGPLLSLEPGQPARVLTPRAVSWIQTGSALTWLDSGGGVLKDGARLATTAGVRQGFSPQPVTGALAESDEVVWWIAGGLATRYELASGSTAQKGDAQGLCRIGGGIGAVVPSAGGFRVRGLTAGAPSSVEVHTQIRPGDDVVLAWTAEGPQRSLELVGSGVPLDRVARSPEAALLAEPHTWASTDGRCAYFVSQNGALMRYDALRGAWARLGGSGDAKAVGRFGSWLACVRESRAGRVLELGRPQEPWPEHSVPLTPGASFVGDAYLALDGARPEQQAVTLFGADGKSNTIRTFQRSVPPFYALNTHSAEVSGIVLLGLSREGQPSLGARDDGPIGSVYLVNDTGALVRVGGIDPGAIVGAQVEHESGRLFVATTRGTIAAIDCKTGEVRELSGQQLGRIGSQLWIVQRSAEGTSVVRARDGCALLDALDPAGRARLGSAGAVNFLSSQGTDVLVCDPPLGSGTARGGLVVREQGGLTVSSTPSLAGYVPQRHTTFQRNSRATSFRGRQLDEDGWFRDAAPEGIRSLADGSAEVTMRDGSRVAVLPAGSCSSTPPISHVGFSMKDQWLCSADGKVRYGRPDDAARGFAADSWIDARPANPTAFFVVDSLRQLWRYAPQAGTWTRRPVALAAGVNPAEIALPLERGQGLVLRDDRGASVGAIVNALTVTASAGLTCTHDPAGRDGSAGPLRWRGDGRGGLTLSLVTKTIPAGIRIDASSSGLSTDFPAGLFESDRNSVELDLGPCEGGRLITSATGDALERLRRARVVAALPAVKRVRSPFRVGSLDFVPSRDSWSVALEGAPVPILADRLAIDSLERAASVKRDGTTILYTLTALQGRIVRQIWGDSLSAPSIIALPGASPATALRTRGNELFVSLERGGWWRLEDDGSRPPRWTETAEPTWCALAEEGSSWAFDRATRSVRFAGQPVELIDDARGFAAAGDVLTDEREPDGGARVRLHSGRVALQSANGSWYLCTPGRIVSTLLDRAPEPSPTSLSWPAASLVVPRRAGPASRYGVERPAGARRELPWRYEAGRLPHEATESMDREGQTGLVLRLPGGGLLRHFQDALGRAGEWSLAESLPPGRPAPPDVRTHDHLVLGEGLELRWKPTAESAQLTLRRASDGEEWALGMLGTRGVTIDDPAAVRLLRFDGARRVDFACQDRSWTRPVADGLAGLTSRPLSAEERAPTEIRVDPDTSRIAARAAGGGGRAEILGAFAADGRLDPARTAKLSWETGRSGARRRLVIPGLPRLDTSLETSAAGWACALERPSLVTRLASGALMTVGTDGRLACWAPSSEGSTLRWVGSGAAQAGPLEAAWRIGETVTVRTAGAATPSAILESKAGFTVVPLSPATGARDAPGVAGLFSVIHELTGARWRIALEGGSEERVPLGAPPGSLIDRVHALGADLLLATDRFGHAALSSASRRYGPLARDRQPGVRRRGGRVVSDAAGDRGSRGLVAAGASRIETCGLETASCAVSAATWTLTIPWSGSGVTIVATVRSGEPSVLLSGPRGAGSRRSVLTDHCLALVDGGPNGPVAAYAVGLEHVERAGPFHVLDGAGGAIAASVGAHVVRSTTGTASMRAPGGVHVVDLESGRTQPLDPGAREYVYFDEQWRVARTSERLEWARRAPRLETPDVARGDEIFTDGQLSFDHVTDVTRSPDGRVLAAATARGLEIVTPTASGWCLEPVGRIGILDGDRAITPVASRLADQQAWCVEFEEQQYRVAPVSSAPSWAAPAREPRTFVRNGRAWVVLPDRLSWLEIDDRWRAARAAYLTRDPSSATESSRTD